MRLRWLMVFGAVGLAACGEATDHPIVSQGGSAGFATAGGASGSANGGSGNGGSANGGSGNGGSGNGGSAAGGGWPNAGAGGAAAGGSAAGGASGAAGVSAGGAAGSGAGGSGGSAAGGSGAGGSGAGGSGAGGSGAGGSGGSAAGGSGAGGSGGTPPVVWNLHRYSRNTQSWQTFPLDQVWTGAGAPPPRGVTATVQLDVFTTKMLLVFADTGDYYLRRGSVWSKARITSKFTRNTSVVEAGYSVPWKASGGDPDREDVFLSSYPNVAIYSVGSNLSVLSSSVQAMEDDPAPNGAPLATYKSKWWSALGDADQYVQGTIWIDFLEVLDNGNLYAGDNSFVWTRYAPASQHDYFKRSGAPNPALMTAAYYDAGADTLNVIGP